MFYEVTSHSGRGQLFNCLYKHFTINVECYTNIVFFGSWIGGSYLKYISLFKKNIFFLLFELIYLLFFVKNVKIVLVASEVL